MIEVTRFRNRKVAVLGLGKAGKSTAKALATGGADVYAWDDNSQSIEAITSSSAIADIVLNQNVTFQPPSQYDWKQFAALILSPGIPFTHPEPHPAVVQAHNAGCPVICDIELLALSCSTNLFLGITGTNGKSTTTALIGHILQSSGIKTQVGGNIGIPVLELDPMKSGVYVLELSSYQLDLLDRAKCNIAVLLNITPDHIDRHGSMEGYIAAKKRIFRNQTEGDVVVIAVEDEHTKAIFADLKRHANGRKIIPVSTQERVTGGVSILDGVLFNDIDTPDMFGTQLGMLERLRGQHNAQNIAASFAATYMAGAKVDDIIKGIRSFQGLDHRLQLIAQQHNVSFINDSKATNAEAAAKALGSFPRNIYWIIGGVPKEGGIASLAEFFPRIRHAFLIGQATDEFAQTLEGQVSASKHQTLDKALHAAAEMAFKDAKQRGEEAVVLLSPACASFDQFKNFEERGKIFCDLVQGLLEKQAC